MTDSEEFLTKFLDYDTTQTSVECLCKISKDNNGCINLYVELAPEKEWFSFRLTDNILSVHNCPTGIALLLKVPHKRLRLQKCSSDRIYPILHFISKRFHDKLDLSVHQKKYSNADNEVLSAVEKVDEIERVTKDRIQRMRQFKFHNNNNNNNNNENSSLNLKKIKCATHSLSSFGLPREREGSSPARKFIRRIHDSKLNENDDDSDDETELVLHKDSTTAKADARNILLNSSTTTAKSDSLSTVKKPLSKNRLSFPVSASSPIANMAFLAEKVNDRSSSSSAIKAVPGVTRKYSRPISSASFYDRKTSNSNGNRNSGGFVNLGNTCYMNAVLQALLNLPQFRRDVSQFDSDAFYKDEKKQEFLECLKLLLKEQKDSKSIVRPDAFLQCVRKLTQQFHGGGQEDADEFLRTVLDLLSLGGSYNSKEEDKENANSSKSKFDPVKANFEFEIERKVYCLNCEYSTENVSIYRDISLFLPKEYHQENFFDIDSLLKSFFMNYQVDYCCEKCGSMEAMIHQGIRSLPRVLVLELKRFDMILIEESPSNTKNGYDSRFEMIKRNDKVLLPSVLDISSLCSKNVASSATNEKCTISATNNSTPAKDNSVLILNSDGDFVEEDPTPPPLKPLQQQQLSSKKYKLKTMISHIGTQPSHGHYVCDVLQKQGDQKFVCYNDAKVETLGTNGSIDDLNAHRSRSSYILFYANEECL